MVKTIELILGLQPLSLFDLIAKKPHEVCGLASCLAFEMLRGTRSSVQCYNRPVLKRALTLVLAAFAFAQQEPKPEPPGRQPQVKMNYLNVCTPSPEEQAGINGALAAVPGKPAFIQDFEISRGLATMKDAPPSKFVRLRREFSPESPFLTAQYSISNDSTSTIETLVLRLRDPKDFYQLSLQDQSSSGAASPLTLLAVDTPVNRVRVERLTKSSMVLARCQDADQNAYEPLFRQASDVMARYRKALGLGNVLHSDLAWLGAPAKSNAASKAATKARK
jgi:hypothetical protein